MHLHIRADETVAHGLPPVAIGLDGGGFTPYLFPDYGTILSLEGPIERLPFAHIRVAKRDADDTRILRELVKGRLGHSLLDVVLEPGEAGVVEIAGAPRNAIAFYGARPRGVKLAGCLAAIPLEPREGTLLVIVGAVGSPRTRPTPEDVSEIPPLARVLESLRLDDDAGEDTARDAPTIRLETPLE
jgi:hypothetical protein